MFDDSWISGGVGYPVLTPTKNGATLDAIELALEIGPTGGGGTEMPEYTEGGDDLSVYDEDINLENVIVRNGVRWILRLMWNSVDRDGRGVLAAVVSLALDGYQFWVQPHKDSTRKILCDLVGPFDVSELFNKNAVGYGPCYLQFKSVAPIPKIHHDDTDETQSYWLAVGGVYDDEELCHWGDVTEEHYTDKDQVAAWTSTGKVYNAAGTLIAEL